MNEQVISLTSSDEEESPEPPPKRIKATPIIVPQVTLSLVPNTKKKERLIETVTLDSDDEFEEPNVVKGIANGTEKVDLITLTDDDEVNEIDKSVNDMLDSILGANSAQIVTDTNVSQDKSDTVSINDSDSEAETSCQKVQPTVESPKKLSDACPAHITADLTIEETAENEPNALTEMIDKNDNEAVKNPTDESNEKLINEDTAVKELPKETVKEINDAVENEKHDELLEGQESRVNQIDVDNSPNLTRLDTNIDSIIIGDSDEETEKENHCEFVDIEPFSVNMEKTSAADVSDTPENSKAESSEIKADIFKKFLKIVEEKIVDSSFEEILPKKVPIIHKYFKKCGSYVNENIFEKFLNDSIELIQKAPNSNAANTAVLAFHKIFEHLKSHVSENMIEIDEEHLPKVKNLEKTMTLLMKRIRQLESAEVNFDDDEDSAYIMLDRYQARLNKVYVKYCEYIRRNPYSGRAIYDKISFVNSKHNVINQAISRKFKNSVHFPSYYELEKYVEKTAKREKLDLSDQEIKRESKKCFKFLGSIFQKKRRQELYDSHLGFIEFTEDPAIKDLSLENVLKKNYSEGQDKIEKLYQKYVDKQVQGEDHVSSDNGETSDNSNSEENGKKSIKKNNKIRMKKDEGKSADSSEKATEQVETESNQEIANGVENSDKEESDKREELTTNEHALVESIADTTTGSGYLSIENVKLSG